jgi:probable FeS assembly SUF system protein SufT
MGTENPIKLRRGCAAVMIPSGEPISLPPGATVWLIQSLGGSYTVMTERGYSVRIDGRDSDALGLVPAGNEQDVASAAKSVSSLEERIWNELRSCFDPEIPINIVDLGLIYDCDLQPLGGGDHKAVVRFTLTAQGCGMGEFLKEDIRKKLLRIPGVTQVDVELVWDPPWNQSMISDSAKQQLGIE